MVRLRRRYYTMLAAIRLNLLVHSTEVLLFLPCSIPKVLTPTRIQALKDHIS